MRGDIGHISLIVVKEIVEQIGQLSYEESQFGDHINLMFCKNWKRASRKALQTRRARTAEQIEGHFQKLVHCPIEKMEARRE